MKNKSLHAIDLIKMIASLEKKSQMQKQEIKHSLTDLEENLKPINLLKNGFRRLFGKGEKVRSQIAEKIFKKSRALPSPRIIRISAR